MAAPVGVTRGIDVGNANIGTLVDPMEVDVVEPKVNDSHTIHPFCRGFFNMREVEKQPSCPENLMMGK